MNDRLCFEVHDNKGYFVFPDTWFGPLLGEFEEVLDAYDTDEISETSYINKLRHLAQREPDFIDIHAHLAYAFLEQNAPRKALNAALKGLAAGNRLIPESFSGEIIWMHPETGLICARFMQQFSQMCTYSVIRMRLCLLIKYWHTILKIIRVPAGCWVQNCYEQVIMSEPSVY